jgi:hypothetical protein
MATRPPPASLLQKARATIAGAAVLSHALAAAAGPPAGVASAPAPADPAAPAARARVHVSVDYEGAVIEIRSSVDHGPWSAACLAPCDRSLLVEDAQLRVVAPRMTASNEFRVAPGTGTARLRVSGGSAVARSLGIAGLVGGIPLSLGGGALFGYGAVSDRQGMQTAGIVTLAVGAVAVVAALPLLLVGSTRVRDARGRMIASTTTRAQALPGPF